MNALIILASYNGDKYLKWQLESIVSQDSLNWTCHIFDDDSKDNTIKIISDYVRNYPGKFTFHRRAIGSGSACNNFTSAYNEIVKYNHNYDYILFCDQDDVWHKNKVSLMNHHFAKNGLNNCAFSDLEVVDADLNLLNNSYYRIIANSDNHYKNVFMLAVDNVVPGCSLAVGREWADNHAEIPQDVIMHDWWIALNACNENCLFYYQLPLVKYRQHENNQVGIKKIGMLELPHIFIMQTKKISKVYRMIKLTPKLKISIVQFVGYYFYTRLIKFWRFI